MTLLEALQKVLKESFEAIQAIINVCAIVRKAD